VKVRVHFLVLLIAAAAPVAFSMPAEINKISAVPDGQKVRIEVNLTSPLTPKVTTAVHPARLIFDFPNALVDGPSHWLAVHANGVRQVRIGMPVADPPVTRVVVDLDSLRPFGVETSDNKVVLEILPPAAREVSGQVNNPAAVVASPMVPTRPVPDSFNDENSIAPAADDSSQTKSPATARLTYKVKYVAAKSAYLDAGSNSGLRRGMKLFVHDADQLATAGEMQGPAVAELRIVAVATTSSVAEVTKTKGDLKLGDSAILAPQDAGIVAAERVLSAINKAPHTAFVASDREPVPATRFNTLRSSRVRGRIGLDYSGISSSGSSPGTSTQLGVSFQSDMTHILGTHWNLQGYWRGRINRYSQLEQETIEDTLNKTYTMQLFYDNPDSPWVAGFGRLYLPWAVSLDTIDGGYFGRRLKNGVVTGVFAGSTPDITSWNYAPDRRIAGAFVNFEGGTYDRSHFSSTSGFALTSLRWKLDRPYLFFENEVSYKQLISVYHSLIADSPRAAVAGVPGPGAGISRSYLTVHLQPTRRLSFDIYHNFFRDVPTAATRIVGTGLVDKLLFQGVSFGVHVEPIRNLVLYSTLGLSDRTGDARRTRNQMYGVTWTEARHTGIQTDFHYTNFDSNFAQGSYRALSLSRQIGNRVLWNVQLGNQSLVSPFTANNTSNFAATSVDVNMGKHSYLQSGYTFVTGASLNYRQWYLSWGYRFDQKQVGFELEQDPQSNKSTE
jgi:AMIN domain